MENLKIQLRRVRYSTVLMELLPHTSTNDTPEYAEQIKEKTEMSITASKSDSEPSVFLIVFSLSIKTKVSDIEALAMSIKAVAEFKLNDTVDDEFMASAFAKVNAPAIAFPYIRTFISNLTLNAGYSPIILPSFNFVSLAKAHDL